MTLAFFAPLILLFSGLFGFGIDDYAQLGSINNGSASVNEILSDPVVRYFPIKIRNECKIEIESFEISLKSKSSDFRESRYLDGELSKEQIALIQSCKPGDIIHFEKILTGCPSCSSKLMKPFQIKVK